ncbi:MAG: hypothetical protein JRJ39_14070 [Deltaproteobacteria bacterium]|nr:hypothetical protein [Deltaproteobacteria bacterium]MBW1847576.1 hypothetical protein [Deltaproteobacteria bacterium]
MRSAQLLSVDKFVDHFKPLLYDPNAIRSLELLSGAFVWSDEQPATENIEGLKVIEFLKVLIAYRASVIRGDPAKDLERTWNEFAEACPTWPGLRPERADCSLKETLDAENAGMIRELERLFDICERAQRIHAIREQRKRK